MNTDITELSKTYEEWKRERERDMGKKEKSVKEKLAEIEAKVRERASGAERAKYYSPEEFVEFYAPALSDFLHRTFEGRVSHVEDLTAHASVFAEAMYAVVTNLP